MKKLYFLFFTFFISFQLLAQTYNWAWYQTIGSRSYEWMSFTNLDIDNNDNIYCIGRSNNDTAFTGTYAIDFNGGVSAFLVKYDNNGNYIWSRPIGGQDNETNNCIKIDNNNNIYVTGRAKGLVSFDGISWVNLPSCGRAYIVKYDEDGNYLWHRFPESGNGEGYYLDTDENDNLYFTCTVGQTVATFENLPLTPGFSSVLAKYDNQNNFEWMREIVGFVGQTVFYEDDYLYYTGYSFGGFNIIYNLDTIVFDTTNQQAYTFKFDLSGNLIWYKQTGNILINNNHIYTGGSLQDTVILISGDTLYPLSANESYYFACFDTSFTLEWVVAMQGDILRMQTIDFDNQNDIWMSAYYYNYADIGSLSFIGGNKRKIIFNISEYGIVNTSNYFEWATTNCIINDYDMKHDSNDNIILSGIFLDCFETSIFYTDTFGLDDIFIAKLTTESLNNNFETNNNFLKIYPNPTTGKFTIKTEGVEKIDIMNIEGRQVYTGKEAEIDLSQVPDGIYIIKVITDKETITEKLIKQ